jgi:hypothetical protein
LVGKVHLIHKLWPRDHLEPIASNTDENATYPPTIA